jgi:TolB-like protein
MPDKPAGRLDSWKQIAKYLRRDVRTVIRWEIERGLPVHRIPGIRGYGVFAERTEIETWLHGGSRAVGRPLIGVLPLTNTVRPGHEHVSDGISENLIRSLSKIPTVRVMAWSTVAHFRGPAGDPVQVGRQLGLSAIAAGRVAQRNGFWQVHMELVDPTDGAQLWGKEYTKPAIDIQSLPNQIARDIVSGMDVHFGTHEAVSLLSKRTVNGPRDTMRRLRRFRRL